jgi:hypothetical protein
MATASMPVVLESATRRTFAVALDWPGWARAGKGEDGAVDALLAAAARYDEVLRRVGLEIPATPARVEVVERLTGSSGTEFGVPSAIADADRAPVDADEAVRLAAIVEASWAAFGAIAAAAPEALRKGPRGGGRDRSKIVAHVIEADAAYAREIGVGGGGGGGGGPAAPAGPGGARAPRPGRAHDAGVEAMRAAMLEVLRTPSDGSPLAGRHWPQRYAARRIAWHALDHAWEIEDRTEH